MPETPQKTVTTRIRSFCQTIAEGDPVFVRCRTDSNAVALECFDNVASKIERAGGSVVSGWATPHGYPRS